MQVKAVCSGKAYLVRFSTSTEWLQSELADNAVSLQCWWQQITWRLLHFHTPTPTHSQTLWLFDHSRHLDWMTIISTPNVFYCTSNKKKIFNSQYGKYVDRESTQTYGGSFSHVFTALPSIRLAINVNFTTALRDTQSISPPNKYFYRHLQLYDGGTAMKDTGCSSTRSNNTSNIKRGRIIKQANRVTIRCAER
jgi:hypothetical protein